MWRWTGITTASLANRTLANTTNALRPHHLTQRLLPRRLELVARVPRRHRNGLRHEPAGVEADQRVLDHPVVHPRVVDLVAGLVIDLFGPLLVLLAAPAFGFADVIRALVEVERGHADLRKVELVGAVEVALVRKLIGHDLAALALDECLRDSIQR